VVLLGEAGAGKSRLAEALMAESQGQRAAVIVGRAFEMESVLPFAPWVDVLRGAAAMGALDDLSPGVRRHLGLLLPELGGDAADAGEGRGNPLALFEAVTETLASFASRRPLLILIEDVHAADEMSLRLFAFLTRRLSAAPVLLLATARQEELAATPLLGQVVRELALERRLTSLDVPRLSRVATLELVRSLAGKVDRRRGLGRLAERVWHWSAGNPFMVVECMHALGAAGPPRAPASLPLPDRVRQVVAGRLDRVTGAAAELLAVAAVLGRQFTFPLLVGASGLDEARTAEGLEELVRRRILRAAPPGFEFDHERIREVAYVRLLPARRRVLHAAAGAALKAVHVGELEKVFDQLAYHYGQAGSTEETIAALISVAATARRRYAIDEALRTLDEALGHVERLPAAARPRRTIELLLRQAPLLSLQARYREIGTLLRPHQDTVETIGDPVLSGPFYVRLALTASMDGLHDDARRLAERARAEGERATDVVTMGRAHYVLAATAFSTGPAGECVEQARRAIALLETTPERVALGRAWWLRALGHFLLGEFAAALDANARIQSIATAVPDHGLGMMGAIAAAWTHITLGDVAAAVAVAERAGAASHDRYIDAMVHGILGYARVIGAADPRGLSLMTEALELVPPRDNISVILRVFLSDAHARLGDDTNARKAVADGLAAARDHGFAWGIAAARRAWGRLAAAAGDAAESRTSFDEALDGFRAIPAPFEVASTCLDLAALVRDGDRVAAAALIAEARSHFAALGLEGHARRADALAADVGRPPGT
jgi:tetratricopeptide (TPR) repeat protein